MSKQQFVHKHLISLEDYSKKDIELIFKTADQFKEVLNRQIKKVPSLRDKTIANVFFENSTRTKLSFELAQKRLSADVINFSASNSSVKKGESLLDTVQNILAMKVDMVVLRHASVSAAKFIAQHTNCAVVNAGSGTNAHPTQGLLDAYSLRDKFSDLKGKKILIVGDILHSRVALSNIRCLKKMGAKVKLCAPYTLVPRSIDELYDVEIETDFNKALKWAEAVNMLRMQLERQNEAYITSTEEYVELYGLKSTHLKMYKDLVVLHPGPINRGIEVEFEVADARQSIILNQVENGVAIRMAILFLISQNI